MNAITKTFKDVAVFVVSIVALVTLLSVALNSSSFGLLAWVAMGLAIPATTSYAVQVWRDTKQLSKEFRLAIQQ